MTASDDSVDHDPTRELAPNEAKLERSVTARTGRARFRTRIRAGAHELEADEPAELGGGDAGPTPFDLLCAALAACTSITLRMYADRKGWALEEVTARAAHSRLEGVKGEDGRPIDLFSVELELSGDLDEAQRAWLGEIAARCPVHRTLLAGARMRTRVA